MNKRIIRLVLFILLVCFNFNINVKALHEELYNEEIGDNTVTEMQEKWGSNNDRVFSVNMIMDGDDSKLYKYLFYSNLYKNSESVQNNSDKRGLNDGEYLEININDLDIDVNSYDDIRLNLGYLSHNFSANIVNYYSLKVYTIDENNIEHGPYYLGDYIPTGYYNQKNTEIFFRGYNLITQNLNDGNYSKIKSIKIVPYGNLPLEIDESETYSGDWRQQASRFYLGSIKVIGYKNETYKNQNVEYQSVNVNDLKINIAKRMYDTATIKWIPDIDMHSLHAVGGSQFRENVLYKAGEVNYGLPYTQRNRVTIEKYNNELDSNYNINSIKDLEGNQSMDFYGQDCGSSVGYSITKYIPLPSLAGVTDYIWNRLNTKLLGDLEIDGTDRSSLAPYNKLCEKYENTSNYNDFSESVLESAKRESRSRIKSNTSKIKYVNKFYIGNEIYDYLTYYEAATNDNQPLTLTLDNQNITSQELLITVVYHKYDGATDLNPIFKLNNEVVTSSEQSSKKIHTYTDSGYKAGIYEKAYKITLDSNQSITKIEFLPYGENAPSTKVFRMSNFIVKSNEETLVNISTAKYDFYYDISSNFKGDENDIHALKDDFISAFNGELTSNYYNGYDSEEKMIKAKFLASQKIFNAYMQLNVGDTVNTQSKSGSIHIRLITGSTHVECLDGYVLGHDNGKVPNIVGTCDSHGGINPLKSYYIRTDINSSPVKTDEDNKNNYGGLINEDDFVASTYWTPNNKYTDINSFSDLENKNLNFMINTKNSFLDGLKKSYLPATLNSYTLGKVEKPYVLLINGNTYNDIKDGFKGTIYSNYSIIKLNFYIKNNKTNEEKRYSIYPSHAPNYPNQDQDINNKTYSRENQFSNYYSLYYNLPLDNSEINNELKRIINSSAGDYIVKVSVDAGTSEDNEVLSLASKKVESISVKTKPTKLSYIQNHETLDLTDGVITVQYSDHTTDELSMTNSGVQTTGFNNSKIGKKNLIVTYQGKSTSFDIEIVSKQIKAIRMKDEPLKKNYIVNYELLDKTGGIIQVIYNDESSSFVSLLNNEVEVMGFNNNKIGTNKLTVTYQGFETTFNVEIVDKKIIKVELKTKPLKTYYIINKEILDLTGGVMLVTYDDETTEEVGMLNNNVKVTEFENKELGLKTVKIEYNGYEIEYDVEIITNEQPDLVKSPNTGIKRLSFIGLIISLIGIVIVCKRKKLFCKFPCK